MKVQIRGKMYEINREIVEESLKDVVSDNIRRYFVELHGKRFPIKQVLSKTLNIPKAGFTTQDAYHILQRLGFDIIEVNDTG